MSQKTTQKKIAFVVGYYTKRLGYFVALTKHNDQVSAENRREYLSSMTDGKLKLVIRKRTINF
jgi:hypothetical protein